MIFVCFDEYGFDFILLGGVIVFILFNILYVDFNGDDVIVEKGRIDKFWKNFFVVVLVVGDDDEIIVNIGNYFVDSFRNILINSI